MLPDKVLKKEFKLETTEKFEDYYPVKILRDEGFLRKECPKCGLMFWTVNQEQAVCGDPACNNGTNLTGNSPAKTKLSYIGVWKKIVEMLEPRGYTPIARYPVIARWNPTADFTMASIAAFQPYVISGEVEPPARKLIIPQMSLRFGDVDNVGITGSHMTGFVMIGQHMFVDKTQWDQEQAFKDIYEFLINGVGLDKKEITIHEDAWGGGGNFGPCMEFFSRGVELFNQVYMMFEQVNDENLSGTQKCGTGDMQYIRRPLDIKVLDMGLGMERIAWFSQGKENIYEATFPTVLGKLKEITNIKMDFELYSRFSKYSALLNADEVDDMDAVWSDIASKLDIGVAELKLKIRPMTALYSVAEHARTLLVALNDGGLPSNVGGGYNLRLIFRRAMQFIQEFKWNIDMGDVCQWHASELVELFPELSEKISSVRKILDSEKRKYYELKKRSISIVERLLQKGTVSTSKLLELYDSQGISPDMIKAAGKKTGVDIQIPDNFYALVSQRHEQKEQVAATKKTFTVDFDIPSEFISTKALYFDDYVPSKEGFHSLCIAVNGQYVVLDKTEFYPTSGGQLNDNGTLNGVQVVDVFKQGSLIIHKMENDSISIGPIVGKVDSNRRLQLTQHHTATHVVNAAAREVLGSHINQAGARKTMEKATLDITHFDNITDDEAKLIENRANEIVKMNKQVIKSFLPRSEAEKKYGMAIYQGGAVPGKEIRIVEIKDIDVQACGGTHLNNTSEIGQIKIIKSSKIQDGVIRLEYTAGKRTDEIMNDSVGLVYEICKVLLVEPTNVPGRAKELFIKWKKASKAVKKKKILESLAEFDLVSDEEYNGDILEKTAEILRTQKENIPKTLLRFIRELEDSKTKLENIIKENKE